MGRKIGKGKRKGKAEDVGKGRIWKGVAWEKRG
jgi:hypothetical protein